MRLGRFVVVLYRRLPFSIWGLETVGPDQRTSVRRALILRFGHNMLGAYYLWP